MPDYACCSDRARRDPRLETLVISTPRPRDATATTLVGRTRLGRGALRDFLGATTAIAWSTSKGGLLGKPPASCIRRQAAVPVAVQGLVLRPPNDSRAHRTGAGQRRAVGHRQAAPWLAGIRKIETESARPRSALVVTVALGGQRSARRFRAGPRHQGAQLRAALARDGAGEAGLARARQPAVPERRGGRLAVSEATAVRQRITSAITRRSSARRGASQNLALRDRPSRLLHDVDPIADARAYDVRVAQYLDTYYRVAPP
jgi:hypothetical protein